jgi:hypothetical protein
VHRVITWNAGDLKVNFNVAQVVRDTGMKTERFLKVPDSDIWHVVAGRVVPPLIEVLYCLLQVLDSHYSSEDEGTAISRNLENRSRNSAVSHLRRRLSSTAHLWKSKISLETDQVLVICTYQFADVWWGHVSSAAQSTCIFRFSPDISKHGWYKCGRSSFCRPSTF